MSTVYLHLYCANRPTVLLCVKEFPACTSAVPRDAAYWQPFGPQHSRVCALMLDHTRCMQALALEALAANARPYHKRLKVQWLKIVLLSTADALVAIISTWACL